MLKAEKGKESFRHSLVLHLIQRNAQSTKQDQLINPSTKLRFSDFQIFPPPSSIHQPSTYQPNSLFQPFSFSAFASRCAPCCLFGSLLLAMLAAQLFSISAFQHFPLMLFHFLALGLLILLAQAPECLFVFHRKYLDETRHLTSPVIQYLLPLGTPRIGNMPFENCA